MQERLNISNKRKRIDVPTVVEREGSSIINSWQDDLLIVDENQHGLLSFSLLLQ